MAYLDTSARKFTNLALIAIILSSAVYATLLLKDARYGSTPPFASAGLAFEELFLRARFGIEGDVRRLRASIGAMAPSVRADNTEARAIPVLTYHRIVGNSNDLNNVTRSVFEDQMRTLKDAGWQTITLAQFEAFLGGGAKLPEKSLVITFDDGAKESFYPVDPLFASLGYQGVVFVIADAMHTPESTYYLSVTELKRMLATGRWEIGSHSFDGHRPYPVDAAGDTGIFFADMLWNAAEGRLETAQEFTARVREDLERARRALESEFGVKMDTFAFPLGNETGIEGAANFSEGASITEREAAKVYSLGFLQTDGQTYTYNYPSDAFLARRIHVDYDWDGERLLRELEKGMPKELPFEDDFSSDRGWIAPWGLLDLGRNNLSLRAEEGASSASMFLDGSALWDDYSFSVSANWTGGSVFLLADVANARTYDSCAFSDGIVRLQSTKDGERTTLAERRDPRITPQESTSLGIRVHGTVVECLWQYESVLESYERSASGGVGLQAWNPSLGTALLQVSEVLVRPLASS